MSIYDVFVQALGAIAWLLIVLSYYFKKENKIIFVQVIATIVYCIHYYLLGAFSGLFICFLEVIRDYLYYKTNKDAYVFSFSLPIYFIIGYFSYNHIFDILPIFSSVIDGFSLIKKRRLIIIGAILSYSLWVVYDVTVGSYSTAITDGLVAISNLSLLLFNKSIFRNKRLNKIFCK